MSIQVLLVAQLSAAAQQPATQGVPGSIQNSTSDRRELTNDQKDVHFIGHVELDLGNDTKVYAEDVFVYGDDNRALASGNVVFAQGENRLSAERAEFNTQTHLGTFFNAWGIATVQPPRQQPRPGAFAPPTSNEPTNVYFFGDKVEKVGVKKYRITNGGFSACVQPTPRWDLHADTVVLNLDHYTLLRNAVLAVKGVPMLYTPFMYYPTNSENRATGFLLPTYGISTLRGQSLSNAFFWAIDRSEDLTIKHDWFSKVGQGIGSEYRYNWGGGSDGDLRAYMLDQHSTTYTVDGTTSDPTTALRSFEIRGTANQILPGNIRARGRADYFSSVQTMQTFNTNIYDVSRNQRTFGGNLIGGWGTYTLSTTLDHSEYFYTADQSVLSGGWPRVSVMRNERPLLGSPVYFSIGTEVVHLLSDRRQTINGVRVDTDSSLSRFDVNPQIRFPFNRWQWFTVNSTFSWRDTYYTRSFDPLKRTTAVVDEDVNRRFFTLQTQLVGPVFSRIWNTPDSGYAEKFKHSIEPVLGIMRTSSIDNFNRIVKLDGTDYFVGGTTQLNYGINNRIYAKRPTTPGGPSLAREIVSVELTQTYYTDEQAAQFDRQYATTFTGTQPNHFSPFALSVRATPTNDVNATVRAEFDSRYKSLRTISASGTYSWSGRIQSTVGWSKKAFIEQLNGFNDVNFLDHYVNTSTSVHTKDNRLGSVYTFNYDVLRSAMLNQRISGFYNAQCCGIALEYQTYNFGAFSTVPVTADHRFFISFTLAGIGNFSPFNGALGGVPR